MYLTTNLNNRKIAKNVSTSESICPFCPENEFVIHFIQMPKSKKSSIFVYKYIYTYQ